MIGRPALASSPASLQPAPALRGFLHGFDRVRYPFIALIASTNGPRFCTVGGMVTESAEEAQHEGLYFTISDPKSHVCGGSAIIPLDFASRSAMVFAEYREFHRIVGPPPLSIGRA